MPNITLLRHVAAELEKIFNPPNSDQDTGYFLMVFDKNADLQDAAPYYLHNNGQSFDILALYRYMVGILEGRVQEQHKTIQ